MDLPLGEVRRRSEIRCDPPPPPLPGAYPARRRRRGESCRHPEAGDLPHATPQLRYPPSRSRLRHPHRPGAPRPPPSDDHDDLHPRPQQGRPRRSQPPRRLLTTVRIIRPISSPFPNPKAATERRNFKPFRLVRRQETKCATLFFVQCHPKHQCPTCRRTLVRRLYSRAACGSCSRIQQGNSLTGQRSWRLYSSVSCSGSCPSSSGCEQRVPRDALPTGCG